MHPRGKLFDALYIWTLYFEPQWRLDSGQRHIETILHRHGPGIREPRKLEFGIHLLNQLFVGHALRPLLARLQHDCGVVHIERRIVGRAVGASNRTENALHFRECAQNAVLLLEQCSGLLDGNARESCRHVKRRALEQGSHEMTAKEKRQSKGQNKQKNLKREDHIAPTQTEGQHRRIQ